jgi:hypothetical protein
LHFKNSKQNEKILRITFDGKKLYIWQNNNGFAKTNYINNFVIIIIFNFGEGDT